MRLMIKYRFNENQKRKKNIMGYYVVKQAKDGQFYFNLKAGNHEIIASSEMYTTKQACMNGIASVQKNGASEEIKDEAA